ncbi:MAG: ImmA/IrrE family metallo-endopeptidase [Veillonellales bacterium]
MTYEELLEESDSKGLTVKEKHLKGNKGLIIEKKIAIRKDIPTNEKACVLAEELGHHETSTGNILTMSQLSSRKQEKQARLWAYNKQIGLLGIIRAYENRCKNKSEISEFLGVTEKFLDDALKCYNQKYGVSVKVDNYVIYFEPNLYILKMI